MKKTVALVLVLCMMLTLACCGKKDVSGLGTLDIGNSSVPASDGIGTLGQPSGGSQPGDSVPAPVPATPVPTPAPTLAPAGLTTENYSCEYFSCLIPSGWDVYYNAYDAGGGMTRLIVFVSDPADSNNVIFYVQALEPFFPDSSAKSRFCQSYGSGYDWAPVLSDGMSAEGVLRQWASVYTFMDTQGVLGMLRFKNYLVQNVLQTFSSDDSSRGISTGALAEVTIPAASTSYAMYLEDTLAASSDPYYSIPYYTSYNNLGFVIDPELYNSSLEVFAACKNSFDFSGFLSGSSITAGGDTLFGMFDGLECVPFPG